MSTSSRPNRGQYLYEVAVELGKNIPQLTGLRGIAALWVFAYHALGQSSVDLQLLRVVGHAGYLGVDLFFVLSGFVLALNYADAHTHRSPAAWAAFLWKRLARIYPVHLATLALLPALVLGLAALGIPFHRMALFTLDGLWRSLTLTHAWIVPMPRDWNLVSWSISCEWAAYLAFPLIATAAMRLRTAASIVTAVAALLFLLGAVIYFGPYEGSLPYSMPRIACEFGAGVLLYRLWTLPPAISSSQWDLIAAAALIVLVLGGNLLGIVAGRFTPLPFAPAIACLVVYALARASGPLSRLLSAPSMLYAGAVSYSFYMVHGTVLIAGKAVLLDLGLTSSTSAVWLSMGAAFIVTLSFSHWIYRSIEVPARAKMLAVGYFRHQEAHPVSCAGTGRRAA